MSPADPNQVTAAVLPAALELTTAYACAGEDPDLYWQTMQRVIDDSLSGADPAHAVAELLFGLSALSSILLDDLARLTGREPTDVLAELHQSYLSGHYLPD